MWYLNLKMQRLRLLKDVIDNDMEIYNNELKINVQTLNIDSASFTCAGTA